MEILLQDLQDDEGHLKRVSDMRNDAGVAWHKVCINSPNIRRVLTVNRSMPSIQNSQGSNLSECRRTKSSRASRKLLASSTPRSISVARTPGSLERKSTSTSIPKIRSAETRKFVYNRCGEYEPNSHHEQIGKRAQEEEEKENRRRACVLATY